MVHPNNCSHDTGENILDNLGIVGLEVKLLPISTLRLKNTILQRMMLEEKTKSMDGEEGLAMFLLKSDHGR